MNGQFHQWFSSLLWPLSLLSVGSIPAVSGVQLVMPMVSLLFFADVDFSLVAGVPAVAGIP